MLNEVLKLTQGHLSMFTEKKPIFPTGKNGECKHGMQFGTECEDCIKEQHAAFRGKSLEREQNNEAFYKDYQGESHD